MKSRMTHLLVALCLAASLGTAQALGQSGADTVAAHRAAAKAAAGRDHPGLLQRVCPETPPAASQVPAPAPQQGQAAPQRRIPPREEWYAAPAKVFDNLYFVGTRNHGAWAITDADGIIVIDALYDYAVEAEVAEGLRKLGFDPTTIKYVIVSHGHGDHHGGAKFLQDRFGARIVMGGPDWDLVARNARDPAPKRDMVATDGMKLTLGETTVTLYLTPGHTAGTISTLVPVRDAGRSHLAASWGGTAFGPATPVESLNAYINSAARFRELVGKVGADVIIANHTDFDETRTKLPALLKRKAGETHPYVIGNDAVKRYLTVAEECAKAELASRGGRAPR